MGFHWIEGGGQFNDICTVIKEVQADIFGGQEHKLDTTQVHVRSTLYETGRQHWDRNRMCFGTTPISFHSHYNPGGTFLVTVGNISGRILHQKQDKWGRWVRQEFSGKDGARVVVISAYQPVAKHGREGNLTVSAQQQSLLLQNQDPTDNPRTAFRRDLFNLLDTYQQAGVEILLMGDFNETFGMDPEGLGRIANELSLGNLMACRHSSSPPATYARGTKFLDYALASHRVSQALSRAGYESFNERLPSDHRGYYFDFVTSILFGSPTQDLATPSKRMLKATNPVQVTTYIDWKYKYLLAHNVFERSEKFSYLGDRHKFAERIDKDVLAASLAAEAVIPVFREPAWSVELVQARQKVQVLKKCVSLLRTGLSNPQVLQEYLQKFPDEPSPPSQAKCSQQWRHAKTEVQEIIKQSYARRDFERTQRLQALDRSVKKADKAEAKRLRKIKKAEDLNELFDKLRRARNQQCRTGVVRLEIPLHPMEDPKTCKEWTQIDVPVEIVTLLQRRNRTHFGQAHGTPFTIPPLSDLLGYTGQSKTQNQMLDGTFQCQEYDDQVRALIQHLQITDELRRDPARPTISEDTFIGKLKIRSESTTTSPSGMHLGHYKALIARHSYSTTAPDDDLTLEFRKRRDELNFRQDALRSLHLRLINYALERGYSYRRWQKVANTILFKDKDNVRTHNFLV